MKEEDKKVVALDTETVGLHGKVRLVQLQFADGTYKEFDLGAELPITEVKKGRGTREALDFSHPNHSKNLAKALKYLDELNRKGYKFILANATYDFYVLGWKPKNCEDIISICRFEYFMWGRTDRQAYSLDKITKKLLGTEYKQDKKEMHKALWDVPELPQEQKDYAQADVVNTLAIWEKLKDTNTVKKSQAYKLDIFLIGYLWQVTKNRIYPNVEDVKKELKALEVEYAKYSVPFNHRSPKQCKEYFGTQSTDKNTLMKLIDEGNKDAEAVFYLRRLDKAKKMLEGYLYPTVYSVFNVSGAVTGRMSATGKDIEDGINCQQIPRKYQYIFKQNNEKGIVVSLDYSTAELRIGALEMGEPVMARELKSKQDIHKLMASYVRGVPIEEVTKAQRQEAKAINFGLLFGMSAPTFKEHAFENYGVKFSLDEAKVIRDRYLAKYKKIARYHIYWWNNYKNVPVESVLGRKNYANLGTDAINFGTQSGIGETTKLAVHYCIKECPEFNNMIENIVHDSIQYRVPFIEGESPEDFNIRFKYYLDLVMRNMYKAYDAIRDKHTRSFVKRVLTRQQAKDLKEAEELQQQCANIPMAVEYEFTNADGEKVAVEVFEDDYKKEDLKEF